MSVLIKGMEMPCCCDECRFLDEYGEYPCCIITDELRGYNFKTREKCMDNCPLIPVPPHGRMIDADALDMNYLHIRDDGMKIYTQRAIDNAPTVIEAEEQSGNSGELED